MTSKRESGKTCISITLIIEFYKISKASTEMKAHMNYALLSRYNRCHNCGDTTPTTLPPAITSPTLSRTVIFTWGPLEYPLWGTSSVCTDGCGFPCPRPRILEGNLPELSCPESAGGSKHGQIITVTHSGHRVLNDGQVREPPLSRGDPGDRRHGGHWRMCTDVSATSTV